MPRKQIKSEIESKFYASKENEILKFRIFILLKRDVLVNFMQLTLLSSPSRELLHH